MEAPPLVFLLLWLGVIMGVLALKGSWWSPMPETSTDPAVVIQRAGDELRAAADALDKASTALSAAGYTDQSTWTARAATRARRAAAATIGG